MEDPRLHHHGNSLTGTNSISRSDGRPATVAHHHRPHQTVLQHQQPDNNLLYYDLPNFYISPSVTDLVGVSAAAAAPLGNGGQETRPIEPADNEATKRMTISRNRKSEEEDINVEAATLSPSTSTIFRNKCVSLLAMLAGLMALSCSLAALAGTSSWVDTWEPIDLPPSSEWSALFGTGYGSLLPNNRNSFKNRDRSSQQSKSSLQNWTTSPTTIATTTTSTTTTTNPPGTTTSKRPIQLDSEEEDEYYAMDEGDHSLILRDHQRSNLEIGVDGQQVDDEENTFYLPQQDQEDEDGDEEPRRALLVVFHVGLFRACPVLKGELAPNVVLPSLPCVALDYIHWKSLSGQSFRLWRNLEFTPDFLNKLRYATPCFCFGSFLSLLALLIGAGRKGCKSSRSRNRGSAVPDVTLVCSSLNILAGLSLGSGLIIFVSILHDEFSLPMTPTSRPANLDIGAGGGSSSWAVSSWQSAAFFIPPVDQTNSRSGPNHQLQPWLLLPSFRYGWGFYAALGGFVGSELAAALYILLHTRLFRWKKIQSDDVSQRRTSNDPPCKEVAVQTSPLSIGGGILVDELSRRVVDQQNSAVLHQHKPYCDLLALNVASMDPELMAIAGSGTGSPQSSTNSFRPSPMYANAISTAGGNETDCTCSHYATYRPRMMAKNPVAGIHKASTMPRKQVGFVGNAGLTEETVAAVVAADYQQTPL